MFPNDDFPAADNNRNPGGQQANDVWAKRFAPAAGIVDPRVTFYEMGRAAGRAEMELARTELARTELARVDDSPHFGRSTWPVLAAVLLAVVGSFSVGRITALTVGNAPKVGNLAFNGAATGSPADKSAAAGAASSSMFSPRDDTTQPGTQPSATQEVTQEPNGVESNWALQGWLFGFQDPSVESESSGLVARRNVEWAEPIDQAPYRLTTHRPGNAAAALDHLPPTAPTSNRNAILQRGDLFDLQFDWNQWFQGTEG
ncbi:MAG TPA: hypothetical protein DDZ51_21730 [Planctomycetaceae bacterium]|nr:hypothetical protein [Planctomycetaceae bacterium]